MLRESREGTVSEAGCKVSPGWAEVRKLIKGPGEMETAERKQKMCLETQKKVSGATSIWNLDQALGNS